MSGCGGGGVASYGVIWSDGRELSCLIGRNRKERRDVN